MVDRRVPQEIKNIEKDNKIININDNENKDETFAYNDKGNIKANSIKNVVILLTHTIFKNAFAWNNFTQSVVVTKSIPKLLIKPGGFKEIYKDLILAYLEEVNEVVFNKDIFMIGLKKASTLRMFNPVLDRINAVKWDEKPRVETFFIDFLGAKDNEYNRQVTRKWLIGAVARALQPGCKFELMPVLIGKQGIGKSTLCNSLCPEYFLDNLPSLSGTNKDNLMLIQDSWVVEVAELSAMSKTAIEGTKAFISTKVDKYKAPYASVVEEHPRRCVFIGTTNDNEFLKDRTGNRRFLPIQCGVEDATKDVFNISKQYILQLLAEAKHYYNNGEKLFLNKDIQSQLEDIQENNVVDDPLEDTIVEFLNMPVTEDWHTKTIFQKRAYYDRYRNDEPLHDNLGNAINTNDLMALDKVTTKDILMIPLKTDGDGIVRASRGNLGKKISLVMNSQPDWVKPTSVRINGKNVRGYKRV